MTPADQPFDGNSVPFVIILGLWYRLLSLIRHVTGKFVLRSQRYRRRFFVAEQWKQWCFVWAFVVSAFALGFSAVVSAGTVSLDLGALSVPSTNNEFLLEFALDGSGMETPNEVFLNDGSTYSYSSNTTSYSQASNPTFTFDFSGSEREFDWLDACASLRA